MQILENHNPDKPNILFIDDEVRILRSLRLLFRRTHNVYTTSDPNEFRQLILAHPMSVIVCDQRMPKITGTELLQEVNEMAPNAMRILLTGYADLAAVIDAINKGQIYRYITKPWDTNELKQVINEATQIAQSSQHVFTHKPPSHSTDTDKIKLMVMFESEVIYKRFCAQFGPQYDIYWASDVNATMEILEKQDIAVVVTDVHFCNKEIVPIINALKYISPQIMVIIVTKHQDSGTFIRLINQGQIFRCLIRPISKGALDQHLEQAVQQYRFLETVPEAGQRFHVDILPEDAQPTDEPSTHRPDPTGAASSSDTSSAPTNGTDRQPDVPESNDGLFAKLVDRIRHGFGMSPRQ